MVGPVTTLPALEHRHLPMQLYGHAQPLLASTCSTKKHCKDTYCTVPSSWKVEGSEVCLIILFDNIVEVLIVLPTLLPGRQTWKSKRLLS